MIDTERLNKSFNEYDKWISEEKNKKLANACEAHLQGKISNEELAKVYSEYKGESK